MAQYRGNLGNLLQHWVFCEILVACRDHIQELAFIDAYSMAPFATERPKPGDSAELFDSVRCGLPGQRTPYEQAWHAIERSAWQGSGYPNSAAFLISLWPRRYSLLLCENDRLTAEELRQWMEIQPPKCVANEIYEGDWRDRFAQNLRMSGDLVLLSFDPYMINRHAVKKAKPGNMYPSDLTCLAKALERIPQGIIVQLSTYSANCGNSQGDVAEMVKSLLKDCGLNIVAGVRANGQIMSFVLSRGFAWSGRLQSLASDFDLWLDRARHRASSGPRHDY